jgi:hypothetical protein
LGLSWADRWLTEIGATTSALTAVHRLAAVADLRAVDLADEALRYGLMGAFLLHALLVRGDCVDLTPFADGVPLGRLATVPVYCSDARRQWADREPCVSKAHGPGCRHHKNLRGDDDLLTLGEWVERLSAAAREPLRPRDVCVCSRCGGFAVHRLNTVQLGYWRAAHQVYGANRAIAAREQHLAGASEPTREPERGDREPERGDREPEGGDRAPALRTFADVGVMLDRFDDEPALAEYVKDLRVRYEVLARQVGVRL